MNLFHHFSLSSLLVNNFVTSKFLGICPFLGVSKRVVTPSHWRGGDFRHCHRSAITTTAAGLCAGRKLRWRTYRPLPSSWSSPRVVQLVEMVIQKDQPDLYRALGVYLPLITTNCAVLGVADPEHHRGYN